jgi:hypothetical protein
LAVFVSSTAAIAALVFGGFLIFPITELMARFNRAPALSKTNELKWLGMQVAFVLPVSMLLLFPVVHYSVYLFYPAMMVLLGAHYIPGTMSFTVGLVSAWGMDRANRNEGSQRAGR